MRARGSVGWASRVLAWLLPVLLAAPLSAGQEGGEPLQPRSPFAARSALDESIGELDATRGPFQESPSDDPRARELMALVEAFERERHGEILEVGWEADEGGEAAREFIWFAMRGGLGTLSVGEEPVDVRAGDWLAGWDRSELGDGGGIELAVYLVRRPGALGGVAAEDLTVAANGLDLGLLSEIGRPVQSLVEGDVAYLLLRDPVGRLREAQLSTLTAMRREGVPAPPVVLAIEPDAWSRRVALEP